MSRLVCASVGVLAVVMTLRIGAVAGPQTPPPPPPQTPATGAAQAPPTKPADSDEGIPITNPTVTSVCGACHKTDEKGRMSRISYRRTTPEGWQETIRRMVTLNKLEMQPAEAREIVTYLANTLGLAPEEVKPGLFEVERRLIDYKYEANSDTATTCSHCHSMGRVLLQRRTEDEWNGLVAMHRGYYPLVDFQAFRRSGPPAREPGSDGRPPDNRHPMDKALAHLKSAFPFTTPEWSAWSATMRAPRVEGAWAVTGYEAGEGPLYGRATVKAGASPAEFTTEISYTYPRSGRTVTRSGRALIYTGFQWRGRTTVGQDEATSLREVMTVDRDWQTLAGRWFSGSYDERGLDVRLVRIGREPLVSGLDRASLRKGTAAQPVRLFGANLPAAVTPRDVDFGRGVTVTRVVAATADVITVEVEVAADAPVGVHDVFVAGVASRTAVAVYDKVDAVRISPAWNMARVGGVVFPKMFAQFEAIGYSNGLDGKPETKDDLNLGPVDASWTIEEYTATFDDDDRKFVGEIANTTGLFTPALDGPNPARSGNRNNIGDVWVVATHKPAIGETLRGRAHLVVTVPLYMRWDFFTLSER
jgi:quinohemoprotein amine dehydrogenase